MSESQRLQLYAIIFIGTIALFTFFNFQRYSDLQSKKSRLQTLLVRSEELQSEFSKLKAIPNDFPFIHQELDGIKTIVSNLLKNAGIPSQSIQDIRDETTVIAESGYSENRITITFRSELAISQIVGFLSQAESIDSDNTTPSFWVHSVSLLDSDGQPSIQGNKETWQCRKLILSCLIKPDKSP